MENKFELNKEVIKKMLNEKEMKFTYEEIEALMDSEVEKSEEEMDTELVAMCSDILAKKYCPEILEEKDIPIYRPWEHMEGAEPAAQPKKRVLRFKYVALVAAVLAVLAVVVALPAGAMLFDNPTSDKIIEFYEDSFKINLNKKEETTQYDSDWINELILENLHTRMLPQVLLSEEYEKTPSVKQDEDKTVTFIDIKSRKSNINGNIMITEYKNKAVETINNYLNVSDMYDCFKQIRIDETDIIIFANSKEACISYTKDNISYDIVLNCDFDTMVSIAETIQCKG